MSNLDQGGASPQSIREHTQRFSDGTLRPIDVVEAMLQEAQETQDLNYLTSQCADEAVHVALESGKRWRDGEPLGPWDGIPFTVKDLVPVRGLVSHRGSRTTPPPAPDSDAPPVAVLRDQGAILMGRTTSTEFGWRVSSGNSLDGLTLNPWGRHLSVGGSSSGAGVAAAVGVGLVAIGSDAGGSVRVPASMTGTYGFKPTPYADASLHAGPMGQLATVGSMTSSIDDLRLSAELHLGHRSFPAEPPSRSTQPSLGWVDASLWDVDPEVLSVYEGTLDSAVRAGFRLREVRLPWEEIRRVFQGLWATGLSRLVAHVSPREHELLDSGILTWAQRGDPSRLPKEVWGQVDPDHAALMKRLSPDLASVDALLTPTLSVPPFPADHWGPDEAREVDWTRWSPFAFLANVACSPSVALPGGVTNTGVPIGVMLTGPAGHDRRVLELAARLDASIHERSGDIVYTAAQKRLSGWDSAV